MSFTERMLTQIREHARTTPVGHFACFDYSTGEAKKWAVPVDDAWVDQANRDRIWMIELIESQDKVIQELLKEKADLLRRENQNERASD